MNVLITGATSGIGRQLALDYASAGHQVICCGRDSGKLAELQSEFPDNVKTRSFDVTVLDECRRELATVGPLDLVLLNAGTCEYMDAIRFDGELFARVVDTNLLGVSNCIDAVLAQIVPDGRLALMGSSASFLPLPRAEAYGASKAAVQYLAKTLQVTLRPHKIQVSYVAPGFVKTPLTDQNDFPMPMRIEVKEASEAIIDGLANGQSEVHFPKKFTWWLKMISALPWTLQRLLIGRLVRAQA